MKKRIILDTDIGGDIDDCYALALALNVPDIEVKAVTTVFVDVVQRTKMTLAMLEAYGVGGLDVAVGAEKPLLGKWDSIYKAYQCEAFDSLPEITCKKTASELIIENVLSGAVDTIVAIGPLTNIAAALIQEPEIAGRTELLLMGGMIGSGRPEWNIMCDPEAAKIVFQSGIPITMAGLDVTLGCVFNESHIRALESSESDKVRLLGRITRIFIKDTGIYPVLHDPLAMALLVWPELFKLEERVVDIETRGELTRGATVDITWKYPEGSRPYNVKVCTEVIKEQFVNNLYEILIK